MTIETEKYLARFKRHYNKAIKNERTQFNFDRQLVLVSYAKYYIEYLETVVQKQGGVNGQEEEKSST